MQMMFTGRDLSMSLKSPLLYFSFPTIRFRRARALGPERPHCVCRVDRTSSWKRRSDAGLGQSRGPVLAGPLPRRHGSPPGGRSAGRPAVPFTATDGLRPDPCLAEQSAKWRGSGSGTPAHSCFVDERDASFTSTGRNRPSSVFDDNL